MTDTVKELDAIERAIEALEHGDALLACDDLKRIDRAETRLALLRARFSHVHADTVVQLAGRMGRV